MQQGSSAPWFQDLMAYYAPLTIDEVVDLLGLLRKLGELGPMPPPGWRRDMSDEEHLRYMRLQGKRAAHLQKELKERKSVKSHAGHELGAREFTLTYSPKWMSDAEARVAMTSAIEKLCRYYAEEIVELRAVGEVGSNGLSHVHCFYMLDGGKKMTDKNFKRAWPHWNPKKVIGVGRHKGHEGGHHATVKIHSDFKGYIDKHVADAWLEKYLKREHNNAVQEVNPQAPSQVRWQTSDAYAWPP